MSNFSQAWNAFWTILKGKEFKPVLLEDKEIDNEKTLKVSSDRRPESVKDAFNNGAVFTLTLLQREGRMIDFLQEDISGFDDAQIGAAVRQIHLGSRKVLEEHFSLIPVINTPENENVIVQENYDPSEITLVGEHPEVGPYTGILQHKGWQASKIELTIRSGKINESIICPAEVSF